MKWTDLAGLGIVGVLAYMIWQGGKDLFSAGAAITEGVQQATAGLSQAPAVISQYINPFDYGGDLLSALATYSQVKAQYDEKVAATEAEIAQRQISNKEVQEAAEAYKKSPSVDTQTKFLEEYKESYEEQLAHIKEGWKTITIGDTAYETPEEWLRGTLESKGLSSAEIDFITGLSPSLPDPLTPTPEITKSIETQEQKTASSSSSTSSTGKTLLERLDEKIVTVSGQDMTANEYAKLRGWY